MSTYIPSSNNGRDSAPMLYLKEPLQNSYSLESPIPPGIGNMMMYMNFTSASSASCSDTLAGNSQHPDICIDIPNVGVSDSNVVSQQEFLSCIDESRMGENDFTSLRDCRNHEMLLMGQMGGRNLQGQGLSLSLGSQIPPSGIQFHSVQYQNPNMGFPSFLSPSLEDESTQKSTTGEPVSQGFHGRNSESIKMDVSQYGIGNVSRVISDSKYLIATQQLLDEVVNVKKALKQWHSKKESMDGSKKVNGDLKNVTSSNQQESQELSAAERQDLLNKLTKLLTMLDDVDRRYKQYYHQMQIIISSFDVIAGSRAAKPYTALALQTISCHFRCLRDAINGQIKVTQRSLGESDSTGNGKGVGISRLRFVDQQLRQQKALQQLGMIQQHTWRPQRGLPESSVSILRAWLFEHFLHPYPKDSEKIMLARQTGLSRSQVSNWFINARVRLWKPMVEEMYKEESGDVEMESNSSTEIAPKNTKGEDMNQSAASTFDSKSSNQAHVTEMAGTSIGSHFRNTNPAVNDYHLFRVPSDNREENEQFMTAAYQMSELGRFGNVNGGGVSLTLGLQHPEDGGLPPMTSLGNHHHGYDGGGGLSVGPETVVDSVDRQPRFGSSHLLHDFVA